MKDHSYLQTRPILVVYSFFEYTKNKQKKCMFTYYCPFPQIPFSLEGWKLKNIVPMTKLNSTWSFITRLLIPDVKQLYSTSFSCELLLQSKLRWRTSIVFLTESHQNDCVLQGLYWLSCSLSFSSMVLKNDSLTSIRFYLQSFEQVTRCALVLELKKKESTIIWYYVWWNELTNPPFDTIRKSFVRWWVIMFRNIYRL